MVHPNSIRIFLWIIWRFKFPRGRVLYRFPISFKTPSVNACITVESNRHFRPITFKRTGSVFSTKFTKSSTIGVNDPDIVIRANASQRVFKAKCVEDKFNMRPHLCFEYVLNICLVRVVFWVVWGLEGSTLSTRTSATSTGTRRISKIILS